MAAEEGNPTAGWISKLFPQQSPVSAPPKKHQQKRGGRSQRKSTRRQRGGSTETDLLHSLANKLEQLENSEQRFEGEEGEGEEGFAGEESVQVDKPTEQEFDDAIAFLQLKKSELAAAPAPAGAEEGEGEELGGGARRSRRGSKKSGSRKAKGGAAVAGPTRTSQSVQYGGRDRVVYQGPRGGKYIKKGGEFVPISKL